MHRYIKRFFYALLIIIVGFCLFYFEEVSYGISQAKGQISIIWNAKPVNEILKDSTFPDSLKSKILLIQEIRKFAFDSLGLNHSENYTTAYDQMGKPILWVVTASQPFELKAKEWSFPFLGTFSYKGFFKHEAAIEAESKLKNEGWDTDIGEVSGWSTLGWFKDPILSSMLKRSSGSLANLIIHELTHGTLYVKDSVQFNENLASFIGDKGAIQFLKFKFGENSSEYSEYIKTRQFNNEFNQRVLKQAMSLDSFYLQIKAKGIQEKKNLKEKYLDNLKVELLELLKGYQSSKAVVIGNEIKKMNNTFFLDYRRYTEDLTVFEEEYHEKYHDNIKDYLKYLKGRYPSL